MDPMSEMGSTEKHSELIQIFLTLPPHRLTKRVLAKRGGTS
jgi:hypothetical protein